MSQPLHKRAIIAISPAEEGEDVTDFLQGLVTNDVTQAADNKPVYAALLSAQGKMQFDFFVWPENFELGAGFLLDCEKELADDLVKRLSLYRLRRKIDIAVDEQKCSAWAPPASEEEEAKGNDPRLAELGFRSILHVTSTREGADDRYLAHRLTHGVAEGREEMGDLLWLETNAGDLNGVSFEKGCYIGQENTARMNWRNKVNRRLMVVPMEVSDPKRRKAIYRDVGLAVDHLRVADIPAGLAPDWMQLSDDEA